MALDAGVLHSLTKGSADDAWRVIIDNAVEIASKPLAAGNAPSEVIKRDREIGALDHFLSSSGWDLWQSTAQDSAVCGNSSNSNGERTASVRS